MPLKDLNLEAGQQKELKTHFEIVSKEIRYTKETAELVVYYYEHKLKVPFEIREVAE